ncbi:uncharacterized protein [Temnothorax longispinosus]|uniref:uncharacterized protein n=1 Tax=Temnothorax longispinosus TaxID=300112 RepID=UPI003A9A162A
MIDTEYAEYKCSACKKEIKSLVVQCRACIKLFFHPGYVIKHKIYNRGNELVKCAGPFNEFSIGIDKVETNKKTPTTSKNGRDRLGSTGSTGSASNTSGSAKSSGVDVKIEWLVKTIKDMRDEMTCKSEIKKVFTEIVRDELDSIKRALDELRNSIQMGAGGVMGQRSYSEAVKEKKNENMIIVKPVKQQESEATKQLVKEKIDIKNLAVGITKLKKGSKGAVILGCENETEMEKLKSTVRDKLGKEYKIMEPRRMVPKIKIINVGAKEMKADEENLIDTILKQNKIDGDRNGFFIRIVKKIVKERRNSNNNMRLKKKGNEEGSIILEADEMTQRMMLEREKVNLGWRKCRVFKYLSVKRCFKCWGYYHIAKNCTRQVACHICAGNHKDSECTATKKKCVNCMHKNKTYNLKINDEHDALYAECPIFKKALEEEERRTGWDVV